MSDGPKRSAGTQLPELPRDLPMPAYKYQQDERSPARPNGDGVRQHDAAALLRGMNLMGCAAAKPIRS